MLKSQLKLTQQVINLTKSVRSLSVTSELDRQDPDSDAPGAPWFVRNFRWFCWIFLRFLESCNHSLIFVLALHFIVSNLASIGIYLAVFSKRQLVLQPLPYKPQFPGSKCKFWIRVKGYKKYKFNPAYYPTARGRHPVTWKVTKANKYKPVSPGNNAHNIPLFVNWGSQRYSSVRVNDPIHGEKYMYPHEITVI